MESLLEYDPATETTVTVLLQSYTTQVLGPIALGDCLFLVLDGVTLMLAGITWHNRGKQLSRYNQWTFHLLVLFNLVCVAFSFQDLFHLMTSNARTYQSLFTFTKPAALQMLWAGIVAFIVQLFLIRRVAYLLQSNKYIVKVLLVGAILSMVGAVFVTIQNFLLDDSIGPYSLLLVANQVWLWATAITDIAISGVLALKLLSLKSGFRVKTDELIDRVVRVTIGSAFPTALFASFAAIAFAATYNTWMYNLYYVFIVPLPAFYTLSFLYAVSGYQTETTDQNEPQTVPSHRIGHLSRSYKQSFERSQRVSAVSGIVVEVDSLTVSDNGDGSSIIYEDLPRSWQATATVAESPGAFA